jgi:streptogramin lyase
MLDRRFVIFALCSLAVVAACNDDDDNNNTSLVRVVNATNSAIDVASGTTIATGNANIVFGSGSSCVTTNSFEPDLNVTPAGTTNSFSTLDLDLLANQTYLIVAFPGFSGATAFATIVTGTAPAAGQAGLRVFNAAAGSATYDVFVTAPGAVLGTAQATGVGFRTASGFITVPPGTSQVRLTNTGTQTVLINAGNLTFTAGQNSVLVIAPPAVGTTALRTFLATGC